MQSRHEKSVDMKNLVAPLSFFETSPCVILPFAFSQRLIFVVMGFFDALLDMAG